MAKIETLTLSTLGQIFSVNGLYMLGYSWLFGMAIWVTFFGGIIALKALPRQQFGTLQHRTFPVYFVISMALTSFLAAKWVFSHPDVVTYVTRPDVPDVAQLYTLVFAFICQATNYFVVSPLTSKTMFQRYKLEKEEGKTYNQPGVSAEMKALNAKFSGLHGLSSLANLGGVIALAFHGLWIAHAGVGGY
ncbi:hypothetical protein NEOLEDRAFT_1068737 [Neolentinus lepideus HHB14362 ss-1]|uniref:TMEM205-like domain-containing protein n=1 Tax=Neolentinus lepideus HHB14362 ss-1 TaxID=1314782 RepID=A0A165RGM6_9AGAM|nr:hypothetical protein NEOLEDRAFT_1068737 [Neolentinus lepideus HHB14362 ss-1]